MSRPRKPFGANHPGRLPSTMIKVLAAEMADPERLRRGKRYAKDGSVLDIVVEPGTVVCEVQGSRSMPYVATIDVTLGDGMPLRRDIDPSCTCPDAEGLWGTAAGGSQICKHVVAAMFVFADELLLDPDLLDVWRGREGLDEGSGPDTAEDPDVVDGDGDDPHDRGAPGGRVTGRRRGHLRLVGAHDRRADEPGPDPLEGLLSAPDGAVPPEIGHLARLEPALPARPELAEVIRDALAHLHIDWD